MQRRRLGDSDILVSEIALGSWLTFGDGVDLARARQCTRAAFEAGINFFDTANIYGRGAAETAWGQILSPHRRGSYVLATKVCLPMGRGHAGGLSAAEIHGQLDASLRRLRTDYVDLYQCHRFDPATPIEETMEALTDVVRSGKVRAIGFSEWLPEQIRAGLSVPECTKFVSSQVQYNLLWRGNEAEVFPLCLQRGISQILWSPLAQGVLTGKYRPQQPPPSYSRLVSERMGGSLRDAEFPYLEPRVLEAVARVEAIAADAGLTMAQLSLAWVLRLDEVASAIVGASRPEQVTENAAASGIRLSDDLLIAIDDALDDAPVRDFRLVIGQRPGVMHR
jgi:aryl-alcohol dehydrogenase-like predicted oxidoreductase